MGSTEREFIYMGANLLKTLLQCRYKIYIMWWTLMTVRRLCPAWYLYNDEVAK